MNEAKSEILNLNMKKSSTKGSIPATILKQCIDIYLPFLTNAINKFILITTRKRNWKKQKFIKNPDLFAYSPMCQMFSEDWFIVGNWELVKLIARTKFRRSHVCLYFPAGNMLWQLMALLFFVMLGWCLYKNWQR